MAHTKKVHEHKVVEEEVEAQPVKEEKKKLHVTYIGPGGLSGEYLFKEISGSVVASSVEEAIEKAEELAVKHPSLLSK